MAKFKQNNLKVRDNNKVIFGNEDDASIYWDGSQLKVSTTLSGVTPTTAGHLTTKNYVDQAVAAASGVTNHAALNNLTYAASGHTGFQPAGSYATTAQLTTTSGDIVAQIPSLSGYATITQLTTTSGDIMNHVELDFISNSEMTTISGDVIAQIPSLAGYVTTVQLTTTSGDILSYVSSNYIDNGEMSTISGDIVSQIPSLSGYATELYVTTVSGDIVNQIPVDYVSDSEMTVISGDIISQIPTDYISDLEMTTISGDIVSQIPTDYISEAEMVTISGDIVSQIPTDFYTTGEVDGLLTTTSGDIIVYIGDTYLPLAGGTITGSLTIEKDLVVVGSGYQTHVQQLLIDSNAQYMNYGEPGAGVTAGWAGWWIDRGTEPYYRWGFFEDNDVFKVGISGTEQPVMTRDDSSSMTNSGIAVWDGYNYVSHTYPGFTYIDGQLHIENPVPTVSGHVTSKNYVDNLITSVKSTFGGTVLYFRNTASTIAGYEVLDTTPAGIPEDTDVVVITAASGSVLLGQYATISGVPNTISIPGGEWTFNIYAKASSTVGTTTITSNVYKRDTGGNETLLFGSTTPDLDTTTTLYQHTAIQPGITLDPTDRLVIKHYAQTTRVSAVTVTYYYEGSEHFSRVSTPLISSYLIEHHNLSDLGADDHVQYHTDARGDARYYTQAQITTISGDIISSAAGTVKEGYTAIANAATSGTVTFPTPFSDATYILNYNIKNTTDANPMQFGSIITTTTSGGFTVLLSGPTDSANYYISWRATKQVPAGVAYGEINTASNLGAGSGVYASKSGVDLRFKSLVAAGDLAMSSDSNTITISGSYYSEAEVDTISGALNTKISAKISDVVNDTTPQLGGDLDANTHAIVAADHGTATTAQVVNVVYGTGAAPTASTTTEGTLFIKYTA
jgi:hypothetical protein